MKVLENFLQLIVVILAMTCAYFATEKLFNVNMTIDSFILGLMTYGVYLIVAGNAINGIDKWFKHTHWDKIEELKKVETK